MLNGLERGGLLCECQAGERLTESCLRLELDAVQSRRKELRLIAKIRGEQFSQIVANARFVRAGKLVSRDQAVNNGSQCFAVQSLLPEFDRLFDRFTGEHIGGAHPILARRVVQRERQNKTPALPVEQHVI